MAGPLFDTDIDAAGPHLLCGWLVSGGSVMATTSLSLNVVRPTVAMSVGGAPAKLPAERFGHFTLAAIHYNVGDTVRSLIWFT